MELIIVGLGVAGFLVFGAIAMFLLAAAVYGIILSFQADTALGVIALILFVTGIGDVPLIVFAVAKWFFRVNLPERIARAYGQPGR